MPSCFQRVTRDQWTVIVRWPREGWKFYRDHEHLSEATAEAVAMRSQAPGAKWRVVKRRTK